MRVNDDNLENTFTQNWRATGRAFNSVGMYN